MSQKFAIKTPDVVGYFNHTNKEHVKTKLRNGGARI
jgi:hypothetical protein